MPKPDNLQGALEARVHGGHDTANGAAPLLKRVLRYNLSSIRGHTTQSCYMAHNKNQAALDCLS
jgi:hypothetical protein